MRSQEIADLAGTTVRALRHYHKIGLLPEVPRDSNGYRRYRTQDLVQVLRIRQLAESGMPLRKIPDVLEQDPYSKVELLDALDRDLSAKIRQLEEKRQLLAKLRARLAPSGWSVSGEQPSETQQLDQDLWTLMTAKGGVDEVVAATLHEVLGSASIGELAATWYPKFEALEHQAHIDDASSTELAQQIADFAETVLEVTGLTPASEDLPVMALVEQMQAEVLSPAQQKVWSQFLAIIEVRWTPLTNSNT